MWLPTVWLSNVKIASFWIYPKPIFLTIFALKMGEIKVVGFGNPLLDTIVKLEDNSLLQKYNLEEDGQKEVSKSDMKALVEDIKE